MVQSSVATRRGREADDVGAQAPSASLALDLRWTRSSQACLRCQPGPSPSEAASPFGLLFGLSLLPQGLALSATVH